MGDIVISPTFYLYKVFVSHLKNSWLGMYDMQNFSNIGRNSF